MGGLRPYKCRTLNTLRKVLCNDELWSDLLTFKIIFEIEAEKQWEPFFQKLECLFFLLGKTYITSKTKHFDDEINNI